MVVIHTCDVCGLRFYEKGKLTQHKQNKKPCILGSNVDKPLPPLICTHCGKSRSTYPRLRKHQRECPDNPNRIIIEKVSKLG